MRATTTVKGRTVLDLRYSRDALGRVTSLVETGPAGPTTTTATDYKYNSADLLSQVIVNGRAVETDSYDPAGNRTALNDPRRAAPRPSYNADNELVRWGQSKYGWAPNGDLARVTDGAGTTSYTFDDLGRLRRVTLPDGESITYLVDAQGQRVGRLVDGRLVAGYLYGPSGDMVAQTNGAGAVVARYGYDQLGHLALVEEGGYTYDVDTGPNGSPLLRRQRQERRDRGRDHLQRLGGNHERNGTRDAPVRVRRWPIGPGDRPGPLRRPRLRPDDGPLDRARSHRLRRWRCRPLPLRGRRPRQQH